MALFALYIALGDSISIDVYPLHDAQLRYPGKFSTDKLGAASLLCRNDDKMWPEFKGRDLQPMRCLDLTADGATTVSLLRQVEQIKPSDEQTLVTITAGGNDLLGVIGSPGGNPVPEIAGRLKTAVSRVLELRPNATVIVGTVYDPSNGTRRLPGYMRELKREAEWLDEYNDFVRKLVKSDKRLRLADIHQHFMGHPEWYLPESIIEPSARGASEVRRLWLEAIGDA
jgi:lysophospholipase L1-like esterase